MKIRFLIFIAAWMSALAPARAENPATTSPETAFDRQVLDTLLGRGLDDTWDISATANKFNPGLPVAIHFSEWGAPVDLGNALQQRAIDQPFELVIGFYEKLPNSAEATVVAVHDLKIDTDLWKKLWGKITPGELKQLQDSFRTGTDKSAMFYAKGESARIRLKGAVMQVDPRIKGLKREIVCYIPFEIFHTQLLNDPIPKKQQGLTLWGQPFKSKIELAQKTPEVLVAAIDRNGKPALPKNVVPASQKTKPEEKKIEVKTTTTVLNESNRVGPPPTVDESPTPKATPEEIEAAIEAAQQGKLTPGTPGVIPDAPKAPPPPVDTGWARIEVEPVKIK